MGFFKLRVSGLMGGSARTLMQLLAPVQRD